jgi:hypothetical protein
MSFQDNHYEIIRGVLHPEVLELMDIEIELLKKVSYAKNKKNEENKFIFSDQQVANSYSRYSPPCVEALSIKLLPLIEKVTGKQLYSSFSYTRIYYKGATMAEHTDRPSCEYAVTINISVDPEPWEIWFNDLNGNRFPILLNPGDLIVYKGGVLPHWRNEYMGKRQTQAFLFYVDQFGEYKDNKYDSRVCLGMPHPAGQRGGI